MEAVSLFSGAGGLDLGFERAGFHILFANECDAHAAATWRANRPHVAHNMHEGALEHRMGALRRCRGRASVLIGGPPCQGFSRAGKMDPADHRSHLVLDFLDAVEVTRPAIFVMENTDNLLTSERFEDTRRTVLWRAGCLGYATSWRCLQAHDFGVAQMRSRAFLIGVDEALDATPDEIFERLDACRAQAPALREVLLPCGEFGSADNPETAPARVTLAKRPVVRKSPYAGMLVNGAGRPMDLDGAAPALCATMGANRTPIVDQRALDEGCENWFASYHRGLVEGSARPADVTVPDHIRRLTVREAAAIQGFGADYVFCGSVSSVYRQVGNAVPVALAYAVARACAGALGAA